MNSDRISDFKKDNEIGKIGERNFIKNFDDVIKSSFGNKEVGMWKCIDVSNNVMFQLNDVDFIMSKNQIITEGFLNGTITIEQKANILKGYYRKDGVIMVEIKTDTVTYGTRNIVLEEMSHNNPGCFSLTKADYFYYVCVDKFNYTDIKEIFVINIKGTRNIVSKYKCEGKISSCKNDISNPNVPMKYSWVEKMGKNGILDKPIQNVLVNIDWLVKQGLAVRFYKKN